MNKIFLPQFFIICFASMSCAQVLSNHNEAKIMLGVFGGLNIPDLSGGNNNELSRDYTSRLGEAFGLTASYFLGSNFAIRADALFSSEGGKRNGVQAINASSINPQAPAGTYLYADFNNESILNYLEIPVMLKYFIPMSLSSSFYVDFGPYAGFLLNARQKTDGSSIIYADRAQTMPVAPVAQSFNASTDITSSTNRGNFGFTGGIGYSQSVGFGAVVLDIRGAYGLTIVQKYSQDGSSYSGYLLLALGYSISL